MMNFNREKYINLIMYILSQCYNKPNFGKTVLCSILYYIDFKYYEIYGSLITEETYIKSKRGIMPKHFRKITEELIEKGELFLRKEPYYNRTIHRYYLTIIPNPKFNTEEQEIIDFTIKKFSNDNATTITKHAIKDPPLIIADFGDEIDCTYVFLRKQYIYLFKK